MNTLRKLIRKLVKEVYWESESPKPNDDLLVEPDDPNEENEENEVSVVANIAGVTAPMGKTSGTSRKKKRLPKGWQKVK